MGRSRWCALEDAAGARRASDGWSGRSATAIRRRDGGAARAAPSCARRSGSEVTIRDWTQEHAAYFRAIRIEKTMMSLILLLVVAVAAFNIVAALVMVVNEKRSDIAILRTLGLAPRGVVGVFLTQGLVIGSSGTLLGVVLGLLLANNVGTIVPALERAVRLSLHGSDRLLHHGDSVRARSRPRSSLIARDRVRAHRARDDLPGLRGAATEPAEALRYE